MFLFSLLSFIVIVLPEQVMSNHRDKSLKFDVSFRKESLQSMKIDPFVDMSSKPDIPQWKAVKILHKPNLVTQKTEVVNNYRSFFLPQCNYSDISWVSKLTGSILRSQADLQKEAEDLSTLAKKGDQTIQNEIGVIDYLAKTDTKWGITTNPAGNSIPFQSLVSQYSFHYKFNDHRCELRTISPEKFLSSMSNKVFSFVGDSLIEQYLWHINSVLQAYFISRQEYFQPTNGNGFNDFKVVQFFYEYNVTFQIIHIGKVSNSLPFAKFIPPIFWASDVFIWSFGAHYNHLEQNTQHLLDDIEDLAKFLTP